MMNFLFTAQGRASRKDYWLRFVLPVLGVYLAAVIIFAIFAGAGGDAGAAIGGLLMLPVFVGVIWASVCVGAKRFHDRNMSGWWVLWFFLIGLGIAAVQYGSMFGLGVDNPVTQIIVLVCTLVSLGLSIVQLVILGFLPGHKGPNQYGPDPLNALGGSADTFA